MSTTTNTSSTAAYGRKGSGKWHRVHPTAQNAYCDQQLTVSSITTDRPDANLCSRCFPAQQRPAIELETLRPGDTLYQRGDHNGMLDAQVVAVEYDTEFVTVEYDGEQHVSTLRELLRSGAQQHRCPARVAHDERLAADRAPAPLPTEYQPSTVRSYLREAAQAGVEISYHGVHQGYRVYQYLEQPGWWGQEVYGLGLTLVAATWGELEADLVARAAGQR